MQARTVKGRIFLVQVLLAKLLREHVDSRLQAIVCCAGLLVVEVAERVPLRGALRVEFNLVLVSTCLRYSWNLSTRLVVEAVARNWRVHEANDLMYESFAEETWCLDRANGPALVLSVLDQTISTSANDILHRYTDTIFDF